MTIEEARLMALLQNKIARAVLFVYIQCFTIFEYLLKKVFAQRENVYIFALSLEGDPPGATVTLVGARLMALLQNKIARAVLFVFVPKPSKLLFKI